MNKHQLHVALLLFLVMLAQLLALAGAAHAAPGDFLFSWGAKQHFDDPSGVTVDDAGNVYVTDTDRVQVYNPSGVRIRKWGSYGSGDGQFSYPNGIALDKSGRVYVVDAGNNRVQVFDSSGQFLAKWRHNWTGNTINGIAVDNVTGRVYVTDSGSYDGTSFVNDSVKVFDREGNFLRYLGSHGSGNGQFRGPAAIATDANGNVYVGDSYSRVLKFDAAGNFLKLATDGGADCQGLAVDRNGNIYVAGAYGIFQFQVEIFDSAGRFVRELTYYEDYTYEHYWVPIAVAVDRAGNVYTLDSDNDGLRVFDGAGNLLDQWWSYGTGDNQLSKPTGLATDSSGNVYETGGLDEDAWILNDRVRVFDGTGRFLRKIVLEKSQTAGITVDESGKVFLLESLWGYGGEPSVHVFDSQGNPVRSWGPYGSEPGELMDPFGVAVEKNGNVLVTDTVNSRVEIYDQTGNFLRHLGTEGYGNGQFLNPEGIAVDRNGNIFVVDAGNSRIEVFDPAYNFVRTWGYPGFGNGQFSHPSGIAVDETGKVFVADAGNNRIQVFASSGAFLHKWGSEGDENWELNGPRGVTVNPSGTRVYVADTGNNRIQVFEGYNVAAAFYISGTVRQGSATGALLPGATLSIAGKTATTYSNGSFKITGIPAGTYTLTISKPGYLTKTITGYVVNGNRGGQVFYLSLATTHYVSGTVRQGSATGTVLPGATVSIAGKSATTYSNGSFKITGILPGTYTVTVSKFGYLNKTITGYVVNCNRSGQVFYLALAPTYYISGTVRKGSATGTLLPGATLTIAGKTATTYSNGSFKITGIPAGTYTLNISKTGYVTRTITGYVVNGNKSGELFYLSPAPAHSISGTVRQGSATGAALQGATVALAGRSTTTYSNGSFKMVGIPEGSYALTISKAGYTPKTIADFALYDDRSGLVYYLSSLPQSVL